jgi:hypothetical protein
LNTVLQVNIRCYQVDYHAVGTIAYKSKAQSLIGTLHMDAIALEVACNAKYLPKYSCLAVSMTVS